MDRAPETDQAGGGRESVRSVWRVLVAARPSGSVTLAADLGGVGLADLLVLSVLAVRAVVDGPLKRAAPPPFRWFRLFRCA
jgi:hypothetical protein